MKAADCKNCDGCQFQNMGESGWCYLFESSPEQLPCSQHDKFEVERKAAKEMFKRNPALFLFPFMINK